ncbi:Gamma-butyrobetaine hydroxylase-like N-terminal protein [Dioscorea alata]|uniref:Gamma-butyrobetaine hydroxylase-like N-terminal protein n=2 Tax=Dioscorea alata TaxID=55571 RepID=A0ACB7WA63_DIOAL|nr:Gamma-butyrobetaine hydroxylase-like N-terminal protein [Dioscorea alata]KAH7684838.1 Gamma-butyrobetaine hydroxylase-like N-terminal protein [Dioscorea alata]
MTALLLAAVRSVCTSAQPPWLTKFTLHPPKAVQVEFSDGSIVKLSAEFLRVHSPSVDSKIRSIGGEKVIFGRRYVGIMSAEPVGNYGVKIIFDDLHKTGIYTWDYFYHLGTNKFCLMRNYIKTLRKHGLSRDPSRRK